MRPAELNSAADALSYLPTRTSAVLTCELDHLGFFPAGFETEVNFAAPKLMSEIAAKLSRGVILTIDYGFSRTEFYSLHRSQGSLQVRANQKKLSSPFQQIGLADISAHVEWTTLAEAAQSSGATPIGFTDQHHFLTGIISKSFPEADFDASEKRALQTLLHPEMLGRNFQALALGKNFRETLSGFQFARDPYRRARALNCNGTRLEAVSARSLDRVSAASRRSSETARLPYKS